jgi:hypothetical protein
MTQPLTAYPWPLTFGVEWEFGVAYLKDDTIPLPHLDDASKILRFTTIDSDYEGKSVYEEKAEFFPHAIRSAIKRSIRNTIKEAGFLVGAIEKDPSEEAEVALWVSSMSLRCLFRASFYLRALSFGSQLSSPRRNMLLIYCRRSLTTRR